jgi:hypothetical protein
VILGCEDCGENLPYVIIDGYGCGDRILEGVLFHFFPNRVVKVRDEDAEYFETLNKTMWIKRVREMALEGEDVICPKCKKEAYVDEE